MKLVPGYRIRAELASGASGTVYRATQEGLGRTVALKLLAPGLFDAAETRARFLREAKLQASLSHPNLLAVYDAGFAGDTPYLAMELAPGGSLRALLEARGALDVAEALGHAGGIAAGLAHAHQAGIVHRDLKPENVLVGEDGNVKLADFGLAKTLAGGQTLQTASGVILGTPGYIAPEAIRGETVTGAADVYALGVTLYEMLAGFRPFGDGDMGEIVRRQLDGGFASLGGTRPGLSPGLVMLVGRCLELDPAARPSAQEATQLLAEAGQARPSRAAPRATAKLSSRSLPAARTAVKAATVRATSPARETRSPRWMLLLAGIAAVAVAGAWLTRGPGERDEALATAERPVPAAIRTIAAGADKARLYLDRPALTRTSAVVSVRGSPAETTPFPIADGALESLLTGLQPATDYEVRLAPGPEGVRMGFTTLRRHDLEAVQATALSTKRVNVLAAASHGRRVAVCWRQGNPDRSETLLFSESDDGGQTWSAPESLVQTSGPSRPALGVTSQGSLVVWAQPAPGHARTFARMRQVSTGLWTDISVPGAAGPHDPGVTSREPLGLLAWNASTPSEALLMKLDEQSGRLRPESGPHSFPHSCREGFCNRLVQAPSGFAAVSTRREGEKSVLQWWEPGKQRPRDLTEPARNLDPEFDVASDGRLVAIAYLAGLDFRVALSQDGGESFQTCEVPFEASPMSNLQATGIAVSGGQTVLAAATVNPLRKRGLAVLRTRDGRAWAPLLVLSVRDLAPRALRVAAAGERVVVLLSDNIKGLLALSLPWR